MKLTQFPSGMHVSEAIRLVIRDANINGHAEGTFNGITITADFGASIDEVTARFEADSAASYEAYRTSPDGISASEQREASLADAKAKVDILMADLDHLDFDNEVSVLDWLCALQEPSDRSGVAIDKNRVLIAFATHGLRPNVNCGADFDGSDRRNFFEWLVGQALDGLASVAIHGVIHKFADEWKAKFEAGRAALSQNEGDRK